MSIISRVKKLEKKAELVVKQASPLYQMRQDLKEIISIKRVMDCQNMYNNNEKHSNMFFGGSNKKECIEEGCNMIKKIIIDLAEKYKKEEGK